MWWRRAVLLFQVGTLSSSHSLVWRAKVASLRSNGRLSKQVCWQVSLGWQRRLEQADVLRVEMGAVEGEAVRERVAGGCEELLEKVEPSEHGRGALDGAPQGSVELLDDGASLWQDRRDLQGGGTSRLSEGASPCAGAGRGGVPGGRGC